MSLNLSAFKRGSEEVAQRLEKELQSIRTGRASPAILDNVEVAQYGAKSKITHLASISVEDSRTLRVTPWDKSAVKSIESAVQAANLGLSVIVTGDGLKIIFPELTAERRELLSRLLKEKLEQAKINIKRHREDVWNHLVKEEREGNVSEDEKFHLKNELQKMVDESAKNLEAAAERKEKEIREK